MVICPKEIFVSYKHDWNCIKMMYGQIMKKVKNQFLAFIESHRCFSYLPRQMINIEKIEKIENNSIVLQFSNWDKKEIDFQKMINNWFGKEDISNSPYSQILDPNYFAQVRLNQELKTIERDNWLDFCPDSLYMRGKEV